MSTHVKSREQEKSLNHKEALPKSEAKTSKPRFRKTLSFQLLLLFTALATCFILILDVAFTVFSYRATMDDVDQSLIDSANNVRDRWLLRAITDDNPSSALVAAPDNYIHIHFTENPFTGTPTDNTDTAKATSPQETDIASITTLDAEFVAVPSAYTVSKRTYVAALPYTDDDDDDDNDDDDDDDVPSKNNSSTNSNTGTGGSNSGGNTGNTGGRPGTNNSGTNNSNTGGTNNNLPTGEDTTNNKTSDEPIVIDERFRPATQLPDESVIAQYGLPKDLEYLEESLTATPQTVDGTGDSDWRAVSIPVRNGTDNKIIGHVVVARPLAPVIDSVHKTSLYLGLFGLGIVAIGSLLAYYLIRRSLRSLHSISESTHAIAAGDLTQRVPSGSKGSEVGMLSDSINVMLNQIEQSFDVKDQSEAKMRQFVSDASHELRTPLTTVRGYAELYRMGGVPTDNMGHTMNRIESEATRMGVLVEDLLQLARLDEKRPLNIETVDVSDVAGNALSDFQVRDSERAVSLVGLDGEQAVPTLIDGDKDKISQVIANLLSNVQTHTPPGTPVELAVGTAVMPTGSLDGIPSEQAVIEVRDHGEGVPEEEREKIFERFFRTDSSRSRDSGGSGLGLSIVSSVMQAHGGYAQAVETDGGGLTVRLVFPTTAPVSVEPVAPVAT